MPDQMRCLLDKVAARRILEGLLKLCEMRDLTEEEVFALALYKQADSPGLRHFMMPPTGGVLRRLEDRPRYATIIHLFRQRAEVAFPARYFKRWARRIQEYGFTPEDASVLALATFGTDEEGSILGMHVVATFDQPMMTQWAVQRTTIQAHLRAMQQDIPLPYRQANLPQVLHPADVRSVLNLPSPP